MLAFTFPGQGSQRPGMGRPWAEHESWELVGEASEIAGRDLGRLLLDADAEELRDTRNAQLTTFVSSLMVVDAVERLGIEPAYCAGHSLGEYTALVATGALSFEEGVRLVAERADAMHDAGLQNKGTMSAVLGLDDDQVEVACRLADDEVWVANFNAPGQVVIAGSEDGVRQAGEQAKQLGAKRVMPLPVAGRLPHALHGAGARPPAQGHRRGGAARHRGAGRVERGRPPPRPRRRVGQPAVGPAVEPGAVEALPPDAGRRRRDRLRRAGPGRRAHRHGQAHRHAARAPCRSPCPTISTGSSSWWPATGPPPAAAAPGRAPVRHRAAGREPGGRRVQPSGHPAARVRSSRPGRSWVAWEATRCARRSPACSSRTSPSRASGSPAASPSPG